MAKANKPADGIEPAFGPEAAPVQAPAPPEGPADTAEVAALKARVAELEAAAAAPVQAPALPAGGLPRFLVKIQHAPSWVVEAESDAAAFEAYKRATGLIATPYPVEVMPSQAELGRHPE